MGKRIDFDQDIYSRITTLIESGLTIAAACQDQPISATTYSRWKRGLESEGDTEKKIGLLQEIKALRSEVKDLAKMKKDVERMKGVLGC